MPPEVDEDELELLDDELELLEEELELLDDELELLLEPLQLAACGLLPVTWRLSIFANPSPVVACKRIRWLPALKLILADAVFQVSHEPVPAKLTAEPAEPLSTMGCPARLVPPPFA